MNLTKEAILAADDLKKETVHVPEWGGTVFVRTMSGLERDQWESVLLHATQSDKFDNLRATLVAKTACNETGERLFTDADIDALGKKSAAALTRVYEVALKVNALTREVREELLKNSDPSPGASSPSD
ncbi:MAG: hypothetical protein WBR15_02795 [Gammaproteobacteria bacterium]